MNATLLHHYDIPPEKLLPTDEFSVNLEPLAFLPEEPAAASGIRAAATVTSESELRAAILANQSPINIANSFEIAETITISGGKNIVIQSLGTDTFTLRRAAGFTSTYMFFIYTADIVTFRNIALNGMAYPGYAIIANIGTLTVEEGTRITNSAASGVVNQGHMTVTGGSFEKNTGASGGGGAIFNNNNATLHIEAGVFRNNTAALYGGAIYSNASAATIAGGEFTGNTAGRNGAAISIVKGSTASIYGNTYIHDNNADEAGGGITIQNSSVAISGNVRIVQNSAQDYGGGVYSHTTTGNFSNISISEQVDIRQNTAGSGGGVFAFLLNDIRISGEAAIAENTANEANGGGVMLYDQAEATISGNVSVQSNTAALSGGGIFIREAGMEIGPAGSDATSISANAAASGGGLAATGEAAAVNIGPRAALTGNTASDRGGGMSVTDGALVRLASAIPVAGNTAQNSGGGAFLLNATLAMTGSAAITGNASPIGSGVADFGLLQVRDNSVVENVYLDDPQHLLQLTGPLTEESRIGFEASGYIASGEERIIVAEGSAEYPFPSSGDAGRFIPPFSGYDSIVYNGTHIAFVWAQSEIVVQFDPNTQDSVSNMPDTIVTVAGPVLLPTQTPQRAGYLFMGWSTRPNGGALYRPGQTIELDADTVLYAQWIAKLPPPRPYPCCCRCCCCCRRRCGFYLRN